MGRARSRDYIHKLLKQSTSGSQVREGGGLGGSFRVFVCMLRVGADKTLRTLERFKVTRYIFYTRKMSLKVHGQVEAYTNVSIG